MNYKVVTYVTGQPKETHLWFKPIKDQIKKNYLCYIFNEKTNLDIKGIEKLSPQLR